MSNDLAPVPLPRPLARAGLELLPLLFAWTGERGEKPFVEFFTAEIWNKNTRAT
jgi:hypothetical protein